jgi:hypothetical protein
MTSTADWAQIISGAGRGAGEAMKGAATYANSKREAKEAKRRTLSHLLNDMNDFQSQALQHVARGFVEAMSGSTGF